MEKKYESPFDLEKTLSREERIKYYLGNLHKRSLLKVHVADPAYIRKRQVYCVNDSFLRDSHNDSTIPLENFEEMKQYYQEFRFKSLKRCKNKQFLFIPGDIGNDYDIPVITKTRPIGGNGYNVILLFSFDKHYGDIAKVKSSDMPYELKKDIILWRGGTTGRRKRMPLVEKYCDFPGPEIDVGFSRYVDGYEGQKLPNFLKKGLNYAEMLQHKFLISVEGNDVATNLKWIMASHSVCIMPHPKIEGWLMEGLLQPWVHYVPVRDDFSDLLDVHQWCVSNPSQCKEIVKNANAYIARFADQDNNRFIINKVLEGYASRVEVVRVSKYTRSSLYSRLINLKMRLIRRRIFPEFISSRIDHLFGYLPENKRLSENRSSNPGNISTTFQHIKIHKPFKYKSHKEIRDTKKMMRDFFKKVIVALKEMKTGIEIEAEVKFRMGDAYSRKIPAISQAKNFYSELLTKDRLFSGFLAKDGFGKKCIETFQKDLNEVGADSHTVFAFSFFENCGHNKFPPVFSFSRPVGNKNIILWPHPDEHIISGRKSEKDVERESCRHFPQEREKVIRRRIVQLYAKNGGHDVIFDRGKKYGKKFPDFIIAGFARCGTTALARNLSRHDQIFCLPKEYGLFRDEAFVNEAWDKFNAYKLNGEKVPAYIQNKEIMGRIADIISNVKIIICLRHPIQALHSLYALRVRDYYLKNKSAKFKINPEKNSFSQVVLENMDIGSVVLQNFCYVNSIRENLLPFFRLEQCFFVIQERMFRNTAAEMNKVFNFFNVEPASIPFHKAHFYDHQRKYPNIDYDSSDYPKAIEKLMHVYGACNKELFELLGEEIPEWEEYDEMYKGFLINKKKDVYISI